MKPGIGFLVRLVLACTLCQFAHASEAEKTASPEAPTEAQAAQALVESLEKELAVAKDRVAELETELRDARSAVGSKQPVAPPTVIAEKFPADTQGQPVAVTRLLEDDLARGGIRFIDRVADQVPNMQYGQSGNEARISMRGARTNRTGAEADPVVAIFEDDITVPTTTQALGPYVDLERIEVLRGPQGVMYGRNTLARCCTSFVNSEDLIAQPECWEWVKFEDLA